jgi:hypothetical protein
MLKHSLKSVLSIAIGLDIWATITLPRIRISAFEDATFRLGPPCTAYVDREDSRCN